MADYKQEFCVGCGVFFVVFDWEGMGQKSL